jgi:hypothetical protein
MTQRLIRKSVHFHSLLEFVAFSVVFPLPLSVCRYSLISSPLWSSQTKKNIQDSVRFFCLTKPLVLEQLDDDDWFSSLSFSDNGHRFSSPSIVTPRFWLGIGGSWLADDRPTCIVRALCCETDRFALDMRRMCGAVGRKKNSKRKSE